MLAALMAGLRPNRADATSGRRKTQFAFVDQVIVSGANFVTGFLLARAVGPEGYGQFTLLFNIVLFLFGVQAALIHSPLFVLGGSVSREERTRYFGSVVLAEAGYLLFAMALMSVFVVVANALRPQWHMASLSVPLVFCTGAFLLQEFVRRYQFARDRAGTAMVNDLVAHGTKVAVLCGFVLWWQLDTPGALYTIGGSALLGAAVALALAPARSAARPPPGLGALRRTLPAHWNFGKWLLAENLAYLCSAQLVIYLTAHLISASAVGGMTAAMNIIGAANVLFLAMENVVPSRAAQIHATRGVPGLDRYLLRVGTLGGACTLAIVGVAVAGAELWLRLLYGHAYAGNGALLAWWGLYYLLGFAQRPFSIGLRVLGVTRALFHATAGAAIVSIVVSYPATLKFGVHGAMAALCLVQAAALLILASSYRAARSRQGAVPPR